jgi:hypothetical protein
MRIKEHPILEFNQKEKVKCHRKMFSLSNESKRHPQY